MTTVKLDTLLERFGGLSSDNDAMKALQRGFA
jgi:hypothetical protein